MVVGENGAGKTSLLEVMSSPRKNILIGTKYFSLFKINQESYFFEGNNLDLVPMFADDTNNVDRSGFYLTGRYDDVTKKFIDIEFVNDRSEIVESTKVIYFSNQEDRGTIFHTNLDEGLRFKRYLIGKKGNTLEKFQYIRDNFAELTKFKSHLSKSLNIELANFNTYPDQVFRNLNLEKFKLYDTGKAIVSQIKSVNEEHELEIKYSRKEIFILSFLETTFTNFLGEHFDSSYRNSDLLAKKLDNKLSSIKKEGTSFEELVQYLFSLIRTSGNCFIEYSQYETGVEHQLVGLTLLLDLLKEIPNQLHKNKVICFPFVVDPKMDALLKKIL